MTESLKELENRILIWEIVLFGDMWLEENEEKTIPFSFYSTIIIWLNLTPGTSNIQRPYHLEMNSRHYSK